MHLFLLSLSFLLTLFFSCASIKTTTKKPEFQINPLTQEKIKGINAISLLDHQLLPIDYLHQHPNQKGLLINHYMGTGKTFLGVGLAESFPENPILILAPKFLQSNWMSHLQKYGVKKPQRFKFVSYDEAPIKLKSLDLSKYIVLADEVHNLIKYMRSMNAKTNKDYTDVYTKLRTAHKIIALTGTPIYGDESDLALIINLVTGQDIMPFNQETFRLEYTKIIPARQFFRGYVTESNLVITAFPFFLSAFSIPFLGPALGILVGSTAGVFLPVIINSAFDTATFRLREFDLLKLKPIMNQYFSYFRFDESKFIDFPSQDFKIEKVPYNRHQYSYFLRLVEGALSVSELKRILKSEDVDYDEEYIRINSTLLHEQIYSQVGMGRDIGNFEFTDDEQKIIEPPKFVKILEQLKKHKEPTVIYSNYYETGIVLFTEFLQRHNYQERFSTIHPNLSMNEIQTIVENYNNGTIKLLLLHPEITEGISLKGTQHLHILEPIMNSTVLEQVVGRTRRFQSHSHLSKDQQKVYVHMWQSTSSLWNPSLSALNRANWFLRYRELNYLSRWGIGLSQVDKNLDKKALNPDELALLKLKSLERNMAKMQEILAKESIENSYR